MRRLASILAVGLALVLLGGCASDGSTVVESVGANVSTDGATWSAGLVITFKEQPDAQFYTFAAQAQATVADSKGSETQFTLPKYDGRNLHHIVLIQEAQARGATITGTPHQ